MVLFLKNLLFTLIVPGTVGVYLPLWIAGRGRAHAEGGAQLAALLLLVAGAAIYFWCLWLFAMDGRATPAPIDAPKVLVVRGPYRYVRNPMYVGAFSAIAGWAVWFGSTGIVWYLAAYFTCVSLFVTLYEEPTLRRLFGEQYARYCENVGRFIPGRPWSGD